MATAMVTMLLATLSAGALTGPVTHAGMAAAEVASSQVSDTIIAVDRGARLDVDNFRGEVIVRSWDRDAVRVHAEMSGRQTLDVVRTASALRVRPSAGRGGPEEADFEIDVPRWMNVRVEGVQVDVSIRGTEGEVSVETVGGDITVEGGRGLINLRSIQGEIVLRGAAGQVEIASVNEDATVASTSGELYVETTNGDVILHQIRSTTARASTVNGDISYDGTISDSGRYVFSTHNGDVVVAVPENAGATVSVSAYHGEFSSDFPVRLTGTTRDRRFTFTIGAGNASLELESFNGEILLRRP